MSSNSRKGIELWYMYLLVVYVYMHTEMYAFRPLLTMDRLAFKTVLQESLEALFYLRNYAMLIKTSKFVKPAAVAPQTDIRVAVRPFITFAHPLNPLLMWDCNSLVPRPTLAAADGLHHRYAISRVAVMYSSAAASVGLGTRLGLQIVAVNLRCCHSLPTPTMNIL